MVGSSNPGARAMLRQNPALARSGLACACTVVLATTLSACSASTDARAAERSASPANLTRVFAAAEAGDTILLEAGDYGTFSGGVKAGMVTLKARPGAKVKIDVRFSPAANITLDGVNLTYAVIEGSETKNITIRNADVTGLIYLRTSELHNANILLDANLHRDWEACDTCPAGRVHLGGSTGQPSGVTIQNSEFRGGRSDGIHNNANGVRILSNAFHDIPVPAAREDHVDAVQLNGSSNTLIQGNFFARVPTAIMAPDGVDHEVVQDNVFAGTRAGYPYAISLGSDNGSIIRHNTFADGDCTFNQRCGTILIGHKTGKPRGRGTIVKDNIVGQISDDEGPGSIAEQSYNLVRAPNGAGRNEISGLPTFVGGIQPSVYAGYALVPGSLGSKDASDGLDRGARIGATTGPPPMTFNGPRRVRHAAELEVTRVDIDPRNRMLTLIATISRRASGILDIRLRSIGRTSSFKATIHSGRGLVRVVRRISKRQAQASASIVTIRYRGDVDTLPQRVRLRAEPRG
jgi:hypothetical protein